MGALFTDEEWRKHRNGKLNARDTSRPWLPGLGSHLQWIQRYYDVSLNETIVNNATTVRSLNNIQTEQQPTNRHLRLDGLKAASLLAVHGRSRLPDTKNASPIPLSSACSFNTQASRRCCVERVGCRKGRFDNLTLQRRRSRP